MATITSSRSVWSEVKYTPGGEEWGREGEVRGGKGRRGSLVEDETDRGSTVLELYEIIPRSRLAD